jgi:hypothetical protein
MSLLETTVIVATIVICTVIIILQLQYYYEKPKPFQALKHKPMQQKEGSCHLSCDALDPVSDPKYNMQQIIKQSILLEEHLSNKNKRCRDCITKHFLHIIGLAEEAQMLATNKIHQYPMINESVALYNELFNVWIKNYNADGKDESYILYCTDKLRDHRKQLIVIYFFNEKYKIEKKHGS